MAGLRTIAVSRLDSVRAANSRVPTGVDQSRAVFSVAHVFRKRMFLGFEPTHFTQRRNNVLKPNIPPGFERSRSFNTKLQKGI